MQINLPRLKDIDWKRTALVIVAILAACSALWNWYHPRTVAGPSQWVPVLNTVTKYETVPGPERIRVIEKGHIKPQLPASVTANPNQQVTAVVDVPASPAGHTAVSTLNMTTGETSVIVQEKRLPLFGFPNERKLQALYGVTSEGRQEAVARIEWDFARIGQVKLGAVADVSSQPRAGAYLSATYEF